MHRLNISALCCISSAPKNHYMSMGKAMMSMSGLLSFMWFCSFILMISAQTKINVTVLESAVSKGAVCLDGSAPAYSYAEGYGNGSTNWIIYLQGGGWCNSIEDCGNRANNRNGSSRFFYKTTPFSGFLDLNDSFNPNFYNWNKVFIYYCDGASFMADVEHPVNNLRFRGARIFKVMIEEMLSKGMKNGRNAILTGSSAGGLATSLHCDGFRALFPHTTTVKCISDSGFFIARENGMGPPVAGVTAEYFAQVIATHDIAKSLPTACTNKMDPNLCLYPENFVGDIKTPLFLIESAFDSIQIEFGLVPAFGGKAAWMQCLRNLTLCNSTELEIMRGFRAVFIEKLVKLDPNPSRGMFVHSFFRHGHLLLRGGWKCSSVYGDNVLANKTIGQAVSDWYFDGSPFQMIDTQNSNPRGSPTQDYDILDQKCLATLSLNSTPTSHSRPQLILSTLCISLWQIFIPLLFY